MLAAENISKSFKLKTGRRLAALADVSFGVRPGGTTALVGPDGSGKSTLLRVVAGLLRPDSGRLVLGGRELSEKDEDLRSQIGYMPQKFGLYEDLTVQENLDLYADLKGVRPALREGRYRELLAMSAMEPFRQRLAGKLSGGMKQKLGLICTLISPPRLLLLDEPTVGVDPLSRRELWEIVARLTGKSGMSVLLSTSYLDEAARCDEMLLLFEGKTLARGAPEEISRLTGSLEDSFMHLLRAQGRQEQGGARPARRAVGKADKTDKVKVEPIIQVKNVSRLFGDFIAVNDVSFCVYPGEVFGLLGPNGAGKTTTFRMLCGLLSASRGSLSVAGVDVREARQEARRRLGYVAQKFSLYGPLSVRENLEFFAGAYGLRGERRARRIREMIAEFTLEGQLQTPAESLPGGYKQRLAMAVGLLHEPAILFLDEPTSGADPLARRDFWKRITCLADEGVTIVVTTHFMEEAEYCDRILIQDSGLMLALGTPEEIRAQAAATSMEDAFIAIVARARAGRKEAS